MSRLMTARQVAALDVPRLAKEQAVASDWDRYLGVVPNSVGRLYTIAGRHGIDAAAIKAAQVKCETQDGGSFSPVDEVKQRTAALDPPVGADQIRSEFRAYTPNHEKGERDYPLVYNDAPGYMSRIYASGAPNFVPTYGVDEDWQRGFKIDGAGYDGYIDVLPTKYKGPYLESLLSPQGTYDFLVMQRRKIVAVVSAASLVLGDDKVVSFKGMPDNCTGWLLRRPKEDVLPSQAGEWPEELTVPSLAHLAMQEGVMVRLDEPLPVPEVTPPMPHTDIQYIPIQYEQL